VYFHNKSFLLIIYFINLLNLNREKTAKTNESNGNNPKEKKVTAGFTMVKSIPKNPIIQIHKLR